MLNRTRKAFTLLELMVAFVIMAILAAVAIPSLQSIVANSQLQADQSSALNIAHAAYFIAQSVYPANVVSATGSNAYDYSQQATDNPGSGVLSVAAGGAHPYNAWFQFANDGVCVTTIGYPALVAAGTTQALC